MSNKHKALPTYVLLILFPAIFGLLLYFAVLKIDKNQELENYKIKLSERIVDFSSKSSPVDYFKPHFQNLTENLLPYIENRPTPSGSLLTEDAVSTIIKYLSIKLNENIRVAIFNDNGILINHKDLLDYEANFFQWAWFEIHGSDRFKYLKRKTDQTRILGREFNVDVMRNQPEFCFLTNSLGKTGVFYFCEANKKMNGIIIFVEYKHTNLELLAAKSKEYSTPDQPIILYNKDNKKCLTPNFSQKELTYEDISKENFLNGFADNDMVWKSFNADDYRLLAGQRIVEPEKYRNKSNIAIIIFILILTAATVFFFKNIANLGSMHISIRHKLVFIFALAVYMPSLSLWVLSYTSLYDRRTAIENEVKKGMLDILNKIDVGHKSVLERAKNSFKQIDKYLATFKENTIPTDSEIENKLHEIVGKDKKISEIINWIEIRKTDLTLAYSSNDEEERRRISPITRILALNCVEKCCPERLKINKSASDILVGDLMGNPIIGFSGIFERPRELTNITFEGNSLYWYWNYYTNKENPIIFYLGNTSLRFTTTAHFKSILKNRYTYNNVNLQLVYLHSSTNEFIPEAAAKYPDLLALIEVSRINQTIETAIVNYLGKKYYCICMPGNNMKESFLLSLYPLSEIDYRIQQIRSTIYTFIMILLIISILTALLLAKTFIVPVKELDRGLTALRKRETATRISIENKDELGLLGNAFNQMMGDIKDMLLAGAVQQCLIPTGKYEIENYDCRVYNQMATDVGGDYADIFELPGDRILIVIGDVTGHGVSSALLTAMVKGLVYRFAHKDTPLLEIVTKISNVINELLKKKKLMTFCAIVLEKATGQISMCNAGHPYPIIYTEKGILRTIPQDGFPLGVSTKRCHHNISEEQLAPGETLFLYTDGFPEAEDANGKVYGYKNFQEFIKNCDINSAESFENTLKTELKKHHGDAELTDDVTFIILKRN